MLRQVLSVNYCILSSSPWSDAFQGKVIREHGESIAFISTGWRIQNNELS